MLIDEYIDGRRVQVNLNTSTPSTTAQHLLGYCHPATLCQHPDCVSAVKGVPMPSIEDIARWRQDRADLVFEAAWHDAVSGHPLPTQCSAIYHDGYVTGLTWLAVHR